MNPGFATVHQAAAGQLPLSLINNPCLDHWVSMAENGCVDVYTGKVELGQGIVTALAQIVADELLVDIAAVRMQPANTRYSPNESVTSGSLSIQHSGLSLRAVCAQIRLLFIQAVARKFHLDASMVTVINGEFVSNSRSYGTYWQIADGVDLHVAVTGFDAGTASGRRDYLGTSLRPIGLELKVSGQYPFIHDLTLPGMTHGRVLRPPSPYAVLGDLDLSEWQNSPGVVSIVRDGSLIGVIAEQEHIAERVVGQIARKAVWTEHDSLPLQSDLALWLRSGKCETTVLSRPSVHAKTPVAGAAGTFTGDFLKSFTKHASIGPSCAYAQAIADTGLKIWSHSQGIHNLKADLCLAFDRDAALVEIQHVPGSGCYGHNGADDVAYDAAWLCLHAHERPVRVQWSRSDELNWSPVGPAMSVRIEADVDENGGVLDWRHTVWGPGHSLRPGRAGTPTLLGSWYKESPHPALSAINAPLESGGGADRNLVPLYDFPCSALVCHRVVDCSLRTSALRALGAFGNVFAIESLIDDIAIGSGRDPLQYRLDNLRDERARSVLNAVAKLAAWHERHDGGRAGDVGMGIGFARYKTEGAYCAVVAKVKLTHEIRVEKLFIAVDVGEVINPDGVVQQIEGGAIQATSWALYEEAHFDRKGFIDGDWESYPIIKFSQVPDIEVEIMPGAGVAPVGAGEPSLGPTAAAIGNAVRDALGVRVRILPITPEAVIRAVDAQAAGIDNNVEFLRAM
ncbi:xanthine dehydrogenase family protein molybdopterin-binding subunit [Paralcaligenes ureilyticus]|uniref:CO/xanthine dehydrogenase Mo-binding subunit n=1 Tax=Paralcaligenes ureilyticus TaxID=627131 RepID=A0A4R3LUF0_9BURK|nr:molybdopterin cofactor-binding domain-containing protein [Paralcaligenes ureilyticus]TCT04091.1 CO/xanthine dehydrogenase Mo-binding subunit [Paralcaligenes ureilyticus]